jgi:nitrogenase-stabilizing/protective protein
LSVIEHLKSLESAEAFFQYLDVPFDPKLLAFARLHILRRMGESLAKQDLSDPDDVAVRGAARQSLIEAYQELAENGPLGGRVFKVLKQRDPAKVAPERGKPFVALSEIVDLH